MTRSNLKLKNQEDKKTLSQHNKNMEEQRRYTAKNRHLAGVLCDTCEKELHYAEPDVTHIAPIPAKRVFCPNQFCPDYKEQKVKIV